MSDIENRESKQRAELHRNLNGPYKSAKEAVSDITS